MMGCMIHVWPLPLAGEARAAERHGIVVRSRAEVPLSRAPGDPVSIASLDVTAVLLEETGWVQEVVTAAIVAAMGIIAQCGVGASRFTLLGVAAPAPFRDLSTPASRRLASVLEPPRPTIYFVRDTRNQPAFDAEAFGTGNTRLTPELRHSVWVTRQAPDLPEAIAHELYHVLANSGGHSADQDNLMHERTAPGRRRLSAEQCATLRAEGRNSGLLTMP